MNVFGTSTRGFEVLFGLFTVLAVFGVLNCGLNARCDKSELFVIFGSAAIAVYSLSRIFGWWHKDLR
jgi:hypothetical protein